MKFFFAPQCYLMVSIYFPDSVCIRTLQSLLRLSKCILIILVKGIWCNKRTIYQNIFHYNVCQLYNVLSENVISTPNINPLDFHARCTYFALGATIFFCSKNVVMKHILNCSINVMMTVYCRNCTNLNI